MATVPGPPTSLAQVRAVFGAPAGTPLHDFVRGGTWVPNISQNAGVPTAPPIRLAQLAGATNYVPLAVTGAGTVNWSGYRHRPPVRFNVDPGAGYTGGSSTPSASWVRISGDSQIVCTNTAAINPQFYCYGGLDSDDPFTADAVWRLTITDGVSSAFGDFHFIFDSI